MVNDAAGIQSANSGTQERVQPKQVVSQQINHKWGEPRGGKERDFKHFEAYPANTMCETGLLI